MSATVLRFPKAVTTDQYFGGCPHCGGSDGFLNIGREQDEDIWLRNRYRLSVFMQVKPVLPHHDGRGAL